MLANPSPFVILVIAELTTADRKALPRVKGRRLVSVTHKSLPRLLEKTNPSHAASPEWLGLARLLEATEAYPHVTVKIWDVTKVELLRDIQRASEPTQSALFQKAYAECLGTFGEDPIGLILADTYVSPQLEDLDLAKGLAVVAAAAGAPVLVGVTPGSASPSDARWERDTRCVFPLRPRWRSAATPGQPWLNPGYLIAARAAAAMHSRDFAEGAGNLLPHWVPEQASAFAAATAEMVWGLQFESSFDEAGVSAVSAHSLSQSDAFAKLTSAGSHPGAAVNLAHLLLSGYVYHHLQDSVRRYRANDSGPALVRVVHEKFAVDCSASRGSEPLVELRNVTVMPNKLLVTIAWHANAGGVQEVIELGAPGIVG